MRLKILAFVAVTGLLGCDGNKVTGPGESSTYGNPQLQLGMPVIRYPAIGTVVSALPVSGTALKKGDNVDVLVEFYLPPEAYPGSAWLQLYAGRVGFTCGYMELTTWSGWFGLGSVRMHCRYPIDEWPFLQSYREYGRGKPLVLEFGAYGDSSDYALSRNLPATYTVQE